MLRLVLGKNIQDFEEIRKNIKSDALDVLKVPYDIFQLGIDFPLITWGK